MGKEFDMVNKLGRRHNLEPKRIPWGEFSWKPLLTGLVFLCFFQYFVYIAHFTKFTRRSSLLMNKLFTCRKIRSRRKSLVKEKKKGKQVQRRKKENSFCEATSIGRAPRWRPDLDKEVASNHNFESCLSIRCLAPQHLLQFFHFCRGFYLCLFATLPIIVPPSSTLQ